VLQNLHKISGGKGIRTPDFQLAKLALYQLSYAPCEFSSLDCGLRIANAMSACVPARASLVVASVSVFAACALAMDSVGACL
jgi:hypothetical protein